jgi:5-formyltetrahydrofolate cyclo-ligase
MPKPSLRKAMLARRRQMSSSERYTASALIQQALTSLPVFVSAQVVALYHAIDNEVATGGLISAAREAGKDILLPAVCGATLHFRKVDDEQLLIPGAFDIAEPPADAPAVGIDSIDLVLVPGIVFDLQGRRIGYGKGYYDRTLHDWEGQGHLIGLCYDFQLVDQIEGEPHDVEMDLILTEKRLVVTRNLP